MSPQDQQMLKEGLGNVINPRFVEQYLADRWLAFVEGKGTGHCETCHGCCRSNYIIGLSEAEAKEIPHTVVDGHAAIIPDEHGVCPFLVDEACSIYEKRPRSCRHFDCRDLAYAGLLVTDDDGLAGAIEMNESILRHIRNNGKKLFGPMRFEAMQALKKNFNAIKASQAALVSAIYHLMPPESFNRLTEVLASTDEVEREKAQTVAVERYGKK